MPWIQNISKKEVANAHHFDPGPNSMLICINDPATEPAIPRFPFSIIQFFEFLDVEDTDITWCPEEAMISDKQAEELVNLLKHALHWNMNVIVHCHAGVCRSGAVVEVATMMGFTDTEKWRSPNLRVKHKMMQVLGLAYDVNEQHRIRSSDLDYLDPRGEIGNV